MNILFALTALLAAVNPAEPIKIEKEFWPRLIQERKAIREKLGKEIDIVLIGDSISHTWDSRCPAVIKEINRDFKFLNLGISGDNTHNVLWRIEKEGELDGYKAKCVMLLIGTNNPSEEGAEGIAAGVKCVLEAIAKKQPEAKVILLPILPRREWDQGTAPRPRPIHDVANRTIRTFADGKKIFLLDIGREFLDDNNDTRWIMNDRLHPEGDGLAIWYRRAKPLFYQLTGKTPPKTTAGWENIATDRKEPAVAEEQLVWLADTRLERNFRLVKRNGAEGKLEIRNGELYVHKSNAIGELVVETMPFPLHSHITVMISAEVHVESATPYRSHATLRAAPSLDDFGIQEEAKALEVCNGRNLMGGLNEQPAGMYYRKYTYYKGKNADVYPRIIISGDPSISVWKNWRAADVQDERRLYTQVQKDTEARRQLLKDTVASTESVTKQCAESIDHTAKMVTENGVTYLTVDGKRIPPSAFHSVYHHGDYSEMTSGQPITSKGVPITIAWVYGANNHYSADDNWISGKTYDAKKAADNLRDMMRGDTNALYMVCYDCNAPRDFVAKCCPDEGWIGEDGKQLVGNNGYIYGSVAREYDHSKYWPWVSMASPTWRQAVKDNMRAFIAELKRTGHAKRIIGVHFLGYNDGQFGMKCPDYSKCAQAEYERYLAANPQVSTNYWQFCRQLGTLAQADFAHAFKEAMGKDVVAIRWDDAPFVVDYSHATMNRDPKGIDITVSQPTYADRWPAVPSTPYVPWSSLQLHNKMHWYELDLRTWWAMACGSVQDATGSGYSPDIEHWRATYRKLAGQMLATRSGFWFYDMGRGWFASPEVADDIGESMKVMKYLTEKQPSSWQSDVAVVIDEEGQFGVEGGINFPWSGTLYNVCERQLDYMSVAGVPYDCYLAEDVIARPEILKTKKVVVFVFWRQFDAKRIAAIKALAGKGKTHVFLCESGCLGGAKEATGFDIEYFDKDARPYALVPEKHFKENVVGSFETEMHRGWDPKPGAKDPFLKATGRQVFVQEAPGVIVHARYAWDTNKVAIAERRDTEARRWYLATPGGLTPEIFQRVVREAGAYLPVDVPGLMVAMNGDFISIHALKGGRYEFKLPFPCKVVNVASKQREPSDDGYLHLNLTPGETCWFLLKK